MNAMVQRSSTGHPSGARLRVVVESADPTLAISDFAAFTAAGLDVSLCDGRGDDSGTCPLLRGEECRLVAGADVVFHALGAGGAGGRSGEILAALCQSPRAVAVVATVDAGDRASLPAGCIALPAGTSVAGQIHALRRAALTHRRAALAHAGAAQPAGR